MLRIDFTNCKERFGKAYNGANGKKITIEYEGALYMLKFPSSGENKLTGLSYTNSCFSEHIGSSIFNLLEVKAQKTLLGTYNIKGRNRIVCACKDFANSGKHFYDFCSIKNTIIDSDSKGNGTELDDILDTIEKQKFINPSMLKKHFWDMFIIDALIGNFDRHNGNWGFLFDEVVQKAEIAPVFDCGSCLLPQADETVAKELLNNIDALNARLFTFPTSAIKQNDKKINYYDFLIEGEYPDCNASLKRIYKKIDMQKIKTFIDTVPYLTDWQKEFYNYYILARYEKIITPSYELIISSERKRSQDFCM